MVVKIPYYPGCTLNTTAKNFDTSARESATVLGLELDEFDRWNCCGTVYSLASDDLIHHVAPVRNLVRVQETGADRLVTLCSMCYNTLKQSNRLVKEDPEKLEKINNFMDREEDYQGRVKVLHLLEILRDEIGFEKISSMVKNRLEGLNLSPYYGCMLMRPKEIGFDDIEEPVVMKDLIESLSATCVDSPFKMECCGVYHTVNNPGMVAERTMSIISAALRRGAESLITSCPLCHFNLDSRQKVVAETHPGIPRIPIFYFTQVLALALGLGEEVCKFDLHYVDPRPLLESKGLRA